MIFDSFNLRLDALGVTLYLSKSENPEYPTYYLFTNQLTYIPNCHFKSDHDISVGRPNWQLILTKYFRECIE